MKSMKSFAKQLLELSTTDLLDLISNGGFTATEGIIAATILESRIPKQNQ